MLRDFRTETIEVCRSISGNDKVEVEAIVLGPFAVHKEVRDSRVDRQAVPTYVVTHLKTGLAAVSDIVTKDVAKAIVLALANQQNTCWNWGNGVCQPYSIPNEAANGYRYTDIIRWAKQAQGIQ